MYRGAEAVEIMERLGNRIGEFFSDLGKRLYESPLFWMVIVVQVICVACWGLSLLPQRIGTARFSIGPYDRLWVPIDELYRSTSCGGYTVSSIEGAPTYTAEVEAEIPMESDCTTDYYTLDETLTPGYWIFSSDLITTELSSSSDVILMERTLPFETYAEVTPRPERRFLRWMIFALWGIPISLAIRGFWWVLEHTD